MNHLRFAAAVTACADGLDKLGLKDARLDICPDGWRCRSLGEPLDPAASAHERIHTLSALQRMGRLLDALIDPAWSRRMEMSLRIAADRILDLRIDGDSQGLFRPKDMLTRLSDVRGILIASRLLPDAGGAALERWAITATVDAHERTLAFLAREDERAAMAWTTLALSVLGDDVDSNPAGLADRLATASFSRFWRTVEEPRRFADARSAFAEAFHVEMWAPMPDLPEEEDLDA